jgi:hypothetical protein
MDRVVRQIGSKKGVLTLFESISSVSPAMVKHVEILL